MHDLDAEFFKEHLGEFVRQLFRAGDEEAHAGELFARGALEVAAQESRRREHDCRAVAGDERGAFGGVERVRIRDHAHAADDREEQADRRAEAVEKRERAEDHIARAEVEHVAKLARVCEQVAVGERDALGLAAAAAGEKQECFVAVTVARDARDAAEQSGGQHF